MNEEPDLTERTKELSGSSSRWINPKIGEAVARSYARKWTRYWASEDRAVTTTVLMCLGLLGVFVWAGVTMVHPVLEAHAPVPALLSFLSVVVSWLAASVALICFTYKALLEPAENRLWLSPVVTRSSLRIAQQAGQGLRSLSTSRAMSSEIKKQVQAAEALAALEGDITRRIGEVFEANGVEDPSGRVSALVKQLPDEFQVEVGELFAERSEIAVEAAKVAAALEAWEVAESQAVERRVREAQRQAAQEALTNQRMRLADKRPVVDTSGVLERLAEHSAAEAAERFLREE